jgi:hypothetical protein
MITICSNFGTNDFGVFGVGEGEIVSVRVGEIGVEVSSGPLGNPPHKKYPRETTNNETAVHVHQ